MKRENDSYQNLKTTKTNKKMQQRVSHSFKLKKNNNNKQVRVNNTMKASIKFSRNVLGYKLNSMKFYFSKKKGTYIPMRNKYQ